MNLPEEISRPLRQAGWLKTDQPAVKPLTGGVSCDIWHVRDGDLSYVVKRALPKLRVKADWHADPVRNRHEQLYMRYVSGFLPEAVPKVLFTDENAGFFAMEFLGAGFQTWKSLLLQENVDPTVAQRVGTVIGVIHRTSWGDPTVAARFANERHFHDLRVEPYLLATAQKHPALQPWIHREASRLESTRRALIHGDYSPKNILVGPDRVVVVDCEVATYGDPAFDVCFLLNHLLLKALHLPGSRLPLMQAAREFLTAHRKALGDTYHRVVLSDGVSLLLCLLLARVDGKSPVEYLTTEADHNSIRNFVQHWLTQPPSSMEDLLEAWENHLTTG